MAKETLTIDKPQGEASNAQGVITQDKSTPRHQESGHKSSFWGLFGGKPEKETPHMVTEEVPGDSTTKPPLMESTPEGVIEGAEALTHEASGDVQANSDVSPTTPDSAVDAELKKINEEAKEIDSPSASEGSEDPQLTSSETESTTMTDEPTTEGDSSSTGDGSTATEGTPSDSDTDVRVDGGALDTDIGGTAVREGQESVTVSDGSPFEGQDSSSSDGSEGDETRVDASGTDELPTPEGQDDSDRLGLESDDQGDRSVNEQPEDQSREDRKSGDGVDSQLAGTQDNLDTSPADQTDKDAVDEDDTLITDGAKLQQQLDEGEITKEEYQAKMTELASKTNVDSSQIERNEEPSADATRDNNGPEGNNGNEDPEVTSENESNDQMTAQEAYRVTLEFVAILKKAGIEPEDASLEDMDVAKIPDIEKLFDNDTFSADLLEAYAKNGLKISDDKVKDMVDAAIRETYGDKVADLVTRVKGLKKDDVALAA